MQSLTQLFTKRVEENSEAVAFHILDKSRRPISITYKVLLERVHNTANHLLDSGLNNSTIIIACESSLDIIIATMACLYVGSTPVILPYLNKKIKHSDLVIACGFTHAKAILSIEKTGKIAGVRWIHAIKVQEKPPTKQHVACSSNDAQIIFVDYSYGEAAFLPFKVKTLVALCEELLKRYDQSCYKRGVAFCFPPNTPFGFFMGFIHPLYVQYECWLLGTGKDFILPYAWLSLISNYQLSATIAPMELYKAAVTHIQPEQLSTIDLASLKLALCSSSIENYRTYEAFTKKFYRTGFNSFIYNIMHGDSACATFLACGLQSQPLRKLHVDAISITKGEIKCTMANNSKTHFASMGKALSNHSVIISRSVPISALEAFQVGEIFVEGPSIASEFLNNSALNDAYYHKDNASGKVYYRTHAFGFLDDLNELYWLGNEDNLYYINDSFIVALEFKEDLLNISHLFSQKYLAMIENKNNIENPLLIVLEKESSQEELIMTVKKHLERTSREHFDFKSILLYIFPSGTLPKDLNGAIDRKKTQVGVDNGSLKPEKSINLILRGETKINDKQAIISLFGKTPEEKSKLLKGWLYSWMALRQGVSESTIKDSKHLSNYGLDYIDCINLAYDILLIFKVWRSPVEIWAYPNLGNLTISLFGEKSSYSKYLDIPRNNKIEPREEASFNESFFYEVSQKDAENTSLNHCLFFHLSGTLNEEALINSLKTVLNHHITLKSHYIFDDTVKRVINDDLEPSINQMDISTLPKHEQDNMLTALVQTLHDKSIYVDKPPLWHVLLAKLDMSNYALGFAFHRIIADDWSTHLVMRDLSQCYNAEVMGYKSKLFPKKLSYSDFSLWQKKIQNTEVVNKQLRYWQEALRGCSELPLPADNFLAPQNTRDAQSISFTLPPDLRKKLSRVSKLNGVSLYVMLTSLFQILLLWFTGDNKITMRCNHVNRHQRGTMQLVGNCESHFILTTKIFPRNSLQDLMENNMKKTITRQHNADLRIEQIKEHLPAALKNKVPNVAFEFYDFPLEYNFNNIKLTRKHGYFKPNHMVRENIKLLLRVRLVGSEVHCELNYLDAIFKKESMQMLVEQYINMANILFDNIHMPINYVLGDKLYKKVD